MKRYDYRAVQCCRGPCTDGRTCSELTLKFIWVTEFPRALPLDPTTDHGRTARPTRRSLVSQRCHCQISGAGAHSARALRYFDCPLILVTPITDSFVPRPRLLENPTARTKLTRSDWPASLVRSLGLRSSLAQMTIWSTRHKVKIYIVTCRYVDTRPMLALKAQ